jgi:hypothetical protein
LLIGATDPHNHLNITVNLLNVNYCDLRDSYCSAPEWSDLSMTGSLEPGYKYFCTARESMVSFFLQPLSHGPVSFRSHISSSFDHRSVFKLTLLLELISKHPPLVSISSNINDMASTNSANTSAASASSPTNNNGVLFTLREPDERPNIKYQEERGPTPSGIAPGEWARRFNRGETRVRRWRHIRQEDMPRARLDGTVMMEAVCSLMYEIRLYGHYWRPGIM